MAVHDRYRWPSSIAGGVLFAAAMMAYSLERLRRAWIIPGDIWYVTAAAHYVQSGALGYVYSAGRHFDALPIPAILLAPVVALGDRWHLSQGYPLPVHHASMWLLLGPVTLLVSGVAVLAAGRALAWDLGCRRGVWRVQLLLAVTGLLPAAVWGHFEDALALAFVMEGARRLATGRIDGGCLCVALAIGTKQWAILGVPVLLASLPRDRRVRAAAICLALPAALAAFPLAVDWAHASRALLFKATPIGLTVGHTSPVVRALGVHASLALRATAFAASIGVALRGRAGEPTRLLAAFGLCFLLRGLLEPVGFAYYLGPGAALLALGVIIANERGKGWSAGTVAVSLAATGTVLWSLWVHGSGWAWYAPELGFAAVTAVAAMRLTGQGRGVETIQETIPARRYLSATLPS